MPSPREQALKIGTVSSKFTTEPDEPAGNVEPRERDYAANPTNPAEPTAPVKNLKEA